MTFTSEMNTALRAVDAAKRKHPVGWAFLDEIGLPGESLTVYAFELGRIHVGRLEIADDIALVYSTGWLQGLAAGYLLGDRERTPRAETAIDLLRSAYTHADDVELRNAVGMVLELLRPNAPVDT